ncbi:MAG: S1 RNA-binding domain-containing protein [Anaerolineae bacterium]|nr:S1 RNA-binding domain-containing protein [Anaerolineae bacterium]
MLVQQVKTTNQPTSPTQPSDERFETLLNAHEPELLRRGEIVEGTILVLDDNLVILDVGAKRDAIVPPQELAEVDDHFLDELETGDVVPVYVTHTPVNNQELLVSLEKGQREQDWQRAEECFNDQSLMELEVVGHNKGGILVQFGRLEGFVPNSHIPMLKNTHDRREYTHKKAKLVGSLLPVQIIELDRNRQRIIMSAAKAYEEQQKKQLETLAIGQVITGQIVNLVKYGAFINFGVLTGLLHISEITWHHIDHPSAKLTVDDEIEVMVIDIDVERKRVSLSRKQLLPDPWEQFAAEYTVGDLIDGVVTSITDFGAFVRFDAGVEGLIHVSEMPLYVSGKPGDLLQLNERVLTRIVSIQPEQQRIGLSMRRVAAAEEIKWLAEQRHKSLPLAE